MSRYFQYKGLAGDGSKKKGIIEAEDDDQAAALLAPSISTLISLEEISAEEGNRQMVADEQKANRGSFFDRLFPHKIRATELTFFTRQLGIMLGAGMSLVNSLEGLAVSQKDPKTSAIFRDIADKIRQGRSFWEALSFYPNSFNKMYINVVRSGEASGKLDEILKELADQMEKVRKIRSDVMGAMYYPVFSMVVAFIVVLIMLVKIIPIFEKMYAGFGAKLPAITMLLISISKNVRSHFFLFAGLFFALIILLRWLWQNNHAFRVNMETLVLGIPFFGSILREFAYVQLCRVLSMLLGSGVHIVESIQLTSEVVRWQSMRKGLKICAATLQEGQYLADGFQKENILPPLATQMIRSGEETGQVDKMLHNVANFYDEMLAAKIKGINSVIEPILIVLLGGLVAVLLLAMYMPIFSMSKAMRGH
jgi:type IV pilus assembly protein PilC